MTDASKPDFVESAIYKASDGNREGQYVAACAKDLCGYSGKSPVATYLTRSHLNQVPLEELYYELGPAKCYDRRGKWFESSLDAVPNYVGSFRRKSPTKSDTRLTGPPNCFNNVWYVTTTVGF
jgi:hypothetical protein